MQGVRRHADQFGVNGRGGQGPPPDVPDGELGRQNHIAVVGRDVVIDRTIQEPQLDASDVFADLLRAQSRLPRSCRCPRSSRISR